MTLLNALFLIAYLALALGGGRAFASLRSWEADPAAALLTAAGCWAAMLYLEYYGLAGIDRRLAALPGRAGRLLDHPAVVGGRTFVLGVAAKAVPVVVFLVLR